MGRRGKLTKDLIARVLQAYEEARQPPSIRELAAKFRDEGSDYLVRQARDFLIADGKLTKHGGTARGTTISEEYAAELERRRNRPPGD